MKVTFLGTGTSQGVPVIGCQCEVCRSLDYRDKRLRTSIHVALEGKSIVIDTGPDFRQQMLREDIRQLDAVLFTHSHKDHIAGLDDVRSYNFSQNRDMEVYGEKAVLNRLRVEFYYAFEADKPVGVPLLNLNEIGTDSFDISGIKIVPLPVMHMYLPVLGFRINDLSYITDANFISEETINKVKGSKVLILNALQREKHFSHFNLEEAIATAKKIGAERTYFLHISHKLGLHKEVSKELPEGIQLAFDGLRLDV